MNIQTIKQEPVTTFSRRQFVQAGLIAAAASVVPWPAWAYQQLMTDRPERFLSLMNTHTGEKLCKVVYWQQGSYLESSLQEIDYLLRDHRTDQVSRIDAGALDMMFALREKFPVSQPFEIISGYRSPETNQLLQRSSSGVAKRSYHMLGQAIDLRLPGVSLKILRKAALQMRRGGVGYYPNSDFIHVDTGPVRSW